MGDVASAFQTGAEASGYDVGGVVGLEGLRGGLGNDRMGELWHRRLVLFAVTALVSLGAEVAYARVVPKLPQLYACLLRAATWDCVLVGVLAAQAIDLSSSTLPLLSGADGSHYLPFAVLVYHFMIMAVCLAHDLLSQRGLCHARSWHRALVTRRALLELAGGTTGARLLLGRACFVASGASMWLLFHALSWAFRGSAGFTVLVVVLLVAYCAAGFAASELRQTLPGHLVQWVFTGWGSREAFLHGPVKVLGALLILPFAISVVVAQIWFRALAFLVWLTVSFPCCRLQRANNIYDAFEREMSVPLLQCSFHAFAWTLSAAVLGAGQLSSGQRTLVGVIACYYLGMLFLWTCPAVLRAKVAAEEAADSTELLGEDGEARLLTTRDQEDAAEAGREVVDIELEDGACERLRALVARERHDRSVESAQLKARLKDQELRVRTLERSLQLARQEQDDSSDSLSQLRRENQEWQARCGALQASLDSMRQVPEVPLSRLPEAVLGDPIVLPQLERGSACEKADSVLAGGVETDASCSITGHSGRDGECNDRPVSPSNLVVASMVLSASGVDVGEASPYEGDPSGDCVGYAASVAVSRDSAAALSPANAGPNKTRQATLSADGVVSEGAASNAGGAASDIVRSNSFVRGTSPDCAADTSEPEGLQLSDSRPESPQPACAGSGQSDGFEDEAGAIDEKDVENDTGGAPGLSNADVVVTKALSADSDDVADGLR